MPLTIERCADLAAAERRLGEQLAAERADAPLARVNVLVASGLQRLYQQRRLARETGPLAAVYFFTPADLARDIADRAPTAQRVPLPSGAAPLLLDDIVRDLAREGALGELDADSPGLAEALAVTFTDLREGGVDEEAFARFAESRSASAADGGIVADLAVIYRRWRARAADLRDRPSLYEDALSDKVRSEDVASALGGAPLIATGMYDFTRVQRRLLARCAEQVRVHVLFPSPPGDAHAASLADVLRKETDADERAAGADAPHKTEVEGFSTADPRAEAAETARRVIDAAERGVKFHEMAVLHRGGAAGDARLADALTRASAPVFAAGGTPVPQTNAGRAALRLIELLCDTPQRARLLEFLGNPALRRRLPGGAPPKPLQWERVSRNAGLTSGWTEFRSHLEGHMSKLEREADGLLYEQQAARELLEVCADLDDRAERIGKAGSWSRAVGEVVDAFTSYVDDGSGAGDGDGNDDYARLIDAIRDVLAGLEGIERVGARYDAGRLLRAARSGLEKARLRPPRAFRGVLIGNASGAMRTIRFDAVFAPGLAERSFPAAPRQDPLLPDGARAALNRALGAEALRLGQTRTTQDRLVFALLEQAARKQLTLSYSRRAAAVGGPSHPSVLLLGALGEMFDEESLNRSERFRRLPAAVSEAAPRPGSGLGEELGDAPDWTAARRAVDESDLRLALLSAPGVDSPQLLRAIGGLQAERADIARLGRNGRLGAFDGIVRPPGVLWDPFDGERTLSATALERYAACPYRFFLANVLGVRAVNEPEESGELSALDRGSLIHEILEAWVKRWLERTGPGWAEYAQDAAVLREIADERLEKARNARQLGGPGIADGLRQQVLDDLEQARQVEAARAAADPSWQPRAVEHEFDKVELDTGDGRAILVKGRIDRIDAAAGGRRRAIDYKTGRHRRDAAEAFRSGYLMQLPLYLEALVKVDDGVLEESSAELFYATGKGNFEREELAGTEFARRGGPDAPLPADELANVLRVITEGITAGRFFPFPFRQARKDLRDTHCEWCQFQAACNPEVGARYLRKARRQPDLTAEFEQLVALRSRR